MSSFCLPSWIHSSVFPAILLLNLGQLFFYCLPSYSSSVFPAIRYFCVPSYSSSEVPSYSSSVFPAILLLCSQLFFWTVNPSYSSSGRGRGGGGGGRGCHVAEAGSSSGLPSYSCRLSSQTMTS